MDQSPESFKEAQMCRFGSLATTPAARIDGLSLAETFCCAKGVAVGLVWR
jgi:hypothetical protein